MACVFKARINPQFNCAGNLKGVAGFRKQTELCPYKNPAQHHQQTIQVIEKSLTGVRFEDRRLALQQRKKTQTKVLPFVTTYHLAVRGLKEILKNNWVLIQTQPLLKSICTKPPIISYKKAKSLKDTLVRAKI